MCINHGPPGPPSMRAAEACGEGMPVHDNPNYGAQIYSGTADTPFYAVLYIGDSLLWIALR